MKRRDWTAHLGALARGACRDVRQLMEETEARGGWKGKRLTNNHFALVYRDSGYVTIPYTTNSRTVMNARAHITRTEREQGR